MDNLVLGASVFLFSSVMRSFMFKPASVYNPCAVSGMDNPLLLLEYGGYGIAGSGSGGGGFDITPMARQLHNICMVLS